MTIPLLFALSWFVAKTRQGRAMRATAQDPDTAGLMGVDVNRTIAITFLIGGALAGAAGVVQILYNNVMVYDMGFRFGLIAFTAAVLGGIGNMQGAVLGALILGVVSAISDRYVSANWTQAIVFGVLIAIMVFKPTACSVSSWRIGHEHLDEGDRHRAGGVVQAMGDSVVPEMGARLPRVALRHRRRRTIALSAIILLGLAYPLIHQYFLAAFSRNVFPLPLPDDTVMTFMTIFAIMAVGLNIVVGFAGLLDLGYVAFYAIGAYVAAFVASPHW